MGNSYGYDVQKMIGAHGQETALCDVLWSEVSRLYRWVGGLSIFS